MCVCVYIFMYTHTYNSFCGIKCCWEDSKDKKCARVTYAGACWEWRKCRPTPDTEELGEDREVAECARFQTKMADLLCQFHVGGSKWRPVGDGGGEMSGRCYFFFSSKLWGGATEWVFGTPENTIAKIGAFSGTYVWVNPKQPFQEGRRTTCCFTCKQVQPIGLWSGGVCVCVRACACVCVCIGHSQASVLCLVLGHDALGASQLFTQLGHFLLERKVLLFQEAGPDGDLVLLQAPGITRALGRHVVLPASGPVFVVLLKGKKNIKVTCHKDEPLRVWKPSFRISTQLPFKNVLQPPSLPTWAERMSTSSKLPSDLRGWRPCEPSWSWAAVSAPRPRICVCAGRTFPGPERWTVPGLPGPAHSPPEPGWSPGRSDSGCFWSPGALQENNKTIIIAIFLIFERNNHLNHLERLMQWHTAASRWRQIQSFFFPKRLNAGVIQFDREQEHVVKKKSHKQ